MTNTEVEQQGIAVDGRHWDAMFDALDRLDGTGPDRSNRRHGVARCSRPVPTSVGAIGVIDSTASGS